MIHAVLCKIKNLSTNALYDAPLLISLVMHSLFFFGIFFSQKINKPDLYKISTNPIVIVLDDVQITNQTNLKIKDTNALGQGDFQKKFSTVVSPDKQDTKESQLNKIESPNQSSASQSLEEGVPTFVKKPRTKPSQFVRKKQQIKTQSVKEDDELASLLSSLDDATTSGSVQSTGHKSGVIAKGSSAFDQSKPVGIDVINSLRSQFARCWTIPVSLMDIKDLSVVVEIKLDQDGNVILAKIINHSAIANKSPFASALADSVLRAVYTCSPIKGLPKESYENWKQMQLSFNADQML